MEVAALLLVLVFFTLSLALTHLCDRLAEPDEPAVRSSPDHRVLGGP